MTRPCSSHVYHVTPDARDLGDLFPAQAWRVASSRRGVQADVFGFELRSTGTKER
jgi:hypothetical protein